MRVLGRYVNFGASAAPQEREKMVLPGLLYYGLADESDEDCTVRGFGVFAGWWHWSVRMTVSWVASPDKQLRG